MFKVAKNVYSKHCKKNQLTMLWPSPKLVRFLESYLIISLLPRHGKGGNLGDQGTKTFLQIAEDLNKNIK